MLTLEAGDSSEESPEALNLESPVGRRAFSLFLTSLALNLVGIASLILFDFYVGCSLWLLAALPAVMAVGPLIQALKGGSRHARYGFGALFLGTLVVLFYLLMAAFLALAL